MYYEVWKLYDPEATEFIPYAQLFDFVDKLKKPFRIRKPNLFKLISLNITICENNYVHCNDILG